MIVLCVAACLTRTARADAQQPAAADQVELHVTSVRGPASRTRIARALAALDFASCQSTFLGGTVRIALHIGVDGRIAIDRVDANEEVGVYVPCIRRALARVRLGSSPAATRARVAVDFPSLGLGRPAPPSPYASDPSREARTRGLLACHERTLRHGANPVGVRGVRITVLASGRVEHLVLLAPAPMPALEACFLAVFERTPFPPNPAGPVELELPFASDATH